MKTILLLVLLSSCGWIPKGLQDNPVEEEIEQYIQDQTGVDIDFTGQTPEKR